MDTIISANEKVLHAIKNIPLNDAGEVPPEVLLDTLQNFIKEPKKSARKYKCSVFNFLCKKDTGYLIYNTLYNTLLRLDDKEYKMYSGEQVSDGALKETFIENGIWVEEDLDEMGRYLACAKAYTLYMQRPLNITITTTLKCNARCFYCYEKGVRQKELYKGAIDDIYNFIKENSSCKSVFINWFGGEPLLNTEVMDSLSQRLADEDYHYASYIITNGSKINELILNEKLQLWHVQNMQITLDGTKLFYEKRKNYYDKNEGEFYKIINNIKLLAERKIYISIRWNIDKENKDDIIDLIKEIEPYFAEYENVSFYPAFITGSTHQIEENEKIIYIKEMLNSLHNIKKITAGTKFYSFPRMFACMNGNPRSYSIDVDGNVYTCEHHVGKSENSLGNIRRKLSIKDDRGKYILLRDECRKCIFLPKCLGGCESNYKNGEVPCMIEKYIIKAYMELL